MLTRSWAQFHKRGAKFDRAREPNQLTVLRSRSLDVQELSCVNCCVKVCMCFCCMLATPSKRQDDFIYCKQKRYSILCMQDTHFIPEIESFIESQ